MTTTWNSVGMPDPEVWNESMLLVGRQSVVCDGTQVTDYMGYLRAMTIEWTSVTSSQRTAIRTQFLSNTSTDLVLPDGYTYTCTPVPESYVDETVGGASGAYDITLQVIISSVTPP